MKQTILVPTDFSNNARVAAHYAIELARKMQAHIHILHAYQPFTSAFQSPSANETDEQRAKTGAEKGLADFLEQLEVHPEVSLSSSVMKNGLLNAINHYIETNPVFLVVMGTHGASGTRKDLLGSNTYDVAKDVSRPLLIVPEHTQSFDMSNVVFFSDYQEGDIKSLKSFQAVFGQLDAKITLIHIHEGNEAPAEQDRQRLEQWKHHLQTETAIGELSAEIALGKQNVEAVNEILEQSGADMTLITLIDSRSFFKKLLHKSLARAIILNPQTPVLLTSEDTELQSARR